MMNTNSTPKAIETRFSNFPPNTSILIEDTLVTIEIEGRKIERPGRVSLVFLPSIRILAQVDLSLQDEELLDVASVFEKAVFSVKSHPSTEWIIISGMRNVRAILAKESFHNISPVEIAYITFNVLNLEPFFGLPVEHPGLLSRGRIVLEYCDWKITIDDTPTTRDSFTELSKVGGYGVTHAGRLEQQNGTSFTSNQAQEQLRNLLYFLSFVRGIWIPPILPIGYDNKNNLVWEKWAIPLNHKWEYVHSWFPTDINATIDYFPSLFKNFLLLIEDREWNKALITTIHWYIECNTLKTTEGTIVLAQAALELLSWMHLVYAKGSLSHDSFNKIHAADQIALLLSSLNISLEVPEELSRLSAFAKARPFENKPLDGPRVITTIRNVVVHPGKNKNPTHHRGEIVVEAKKLILWYLELTMLHLLQHDGNYSSRVHNGENLLVPWSHKFIGKI